MLIETIIVMCIAVLLGLWLSTQYLILETVPAALARVALVHGAAGAVCVGMLYLALQRPGPPAGRFGWTAFVMLAATLAGGVTILSFNLRRKAPPVVLVAMHAVVGLAGAVILAAYFSTPASFGR